MALNKSFNVGANIDLTDIELKKTTNSASVRRGRQTERVVGKDDNVKEKVKTITATDYAVKEEEQDSASGIDFLIEKKKETKDVRKSFLLLPSVDEKLTSTAKKYGISQNDLINQILKNFFEKSKL